MAFDCLHALFESSVISYGSQTCFRTDTNVAGLRVVLSHMVVKLENGFIEVAASLRVVLSHMVVKPLDNYIIPRTCLRVVLSHMVVKLSWGGDG